MRCDYRDSAGMCKYIAAVLYGLGACLDHNHERLFTLRHVDHLDFLAEMDSRQGLLQQKDNQQIFDEDLSQLFGIEKSDPRTHSKGFM